MAHTLKIAMSRTTGVVINVEEWDTPPAINSQMVYAISDAAGIGWRYNQATGTFTPPAAPAPVQASVPMINARLALNAAGLLTSVQTAINSADQATQIWWEYSTTVARQDPVLLQVAAALSPPLSADQLDALFIAAAKLG